MLLTKVILSVCALEILAAAGNVIPSNRSPIENCCDLGFRQIVFSEVVNKPKVYKFKNFCNNARSSPTAGYCDTVTDGGGWLVIQRRTNGSENFHRNWNEYEMGFGNLMGEFWYGLRALHCLTKYRPWELRIDLTINGIKTYLHHNNFRIEPASDQY